MHEPFERGAGVFAARITPAGERLFYFRYAGEKGARRYLKLGPFGAHGSGGGLTVGTARLLARDRSALYLSGVRNLHEHFETLARANTVAAEVALKQNAAELERTTQLAAIAAEEQSRRTTVRRLFERWVEIELRPRTRGGDGRRVGRKDGGRFTREQFERRVFPKVADWPIEQVRKADLLELLDAVKAEGKLRTANVLLADLKQMFRFALSREMVDRNPLEGVTKREVGGASVERDRVLSRAELAQLAGALPASGLPARAATAIRLILASGVRIGELIGATWSDLGVPSVELSMIAEACDVKFGVIDAAARTWHLAQTKNQRDHTIHLSDFALRQIAVLAKIRAEEADLGVPPSPWLFPGADISRPIGVKVLGKQIADRQREDERRLTNRPRATSALLLPGGRWTAHDLRRTAATLMAESGISGDVIDECLNHQIESRVRRIYIRNRRLSEQARALDELGAVLGGLFDADDGPRTTGGPAD